jgi:hypothetical protein
LLQNCAILRNALQVLIVSRTERQQPYARE